MFNFFEYSKLLVVNMIPLIDWVNELSMMIRWWLCVVWVQQSFLRTPDWEVIVELLIWCMPYGMCILELIGYDSNDMSECLLSLFARLSIVEVGTIMLWCTSLAQDQCTKAGVDHSTSGTWFYFVCVHPNRPCEEYIIMPLIRHWLHTTCTHQDKLGIHIRLVK